MTGPRLVLTIEPGTVAARVPITPDDSIVVVVGASGYRCFVNYSAGSVDAKKPNGHFAGHARFVSESALPKAFENTWRFHAVAASSGDAYEIPLKAIKPAKPRCAACGRSMPKIGHGRANGANHADWASRNFHKSCWKSIQ